MIRYEDGKWKLYTSDGSRVLGTHETKEDAEAQERAVQRSTHTAHHMAKIIRLPQR